MVTELTVKDLMPYDKLIAINNDGEISIICTRKAYGYWRIFYPNIKKGSPYHTFHNKELVSLFNNPYSREGIVSLSGVKTSKSGKEKMGILYERK